MKLTDDQQTIVDRALFIVRNNFGTYDTKFDDPDKVKKFVSLRIGSSEREHFLVLFLNTQRELIADEIMFSGTIDASAVFPREIVKRALELNAKSIIISHNHPSGTSKESDGDRVLTDRIGAAVELFDIKLLDHIIVGHTMLSFAQSGICQKALS